ncbi:hypothetical protein LOK49_LG01G01961 [Camellia lanceoleosa]|uniref:Uncharacterized protein n=1 Tax=Camellia lanceoleosa TaxID=1840588 RepID=A0ACC0IWI0_9ERIC|nr:hypothetical protein LOK49_LG01G01961 [Camellia lanceoleosa]
MATNRLASVTNRHRSSHFCCYSPRLSHICGWYSSSSHLSIALSPILLLLLSFLISSAAALTSSHYWLFQRYFFTCHYYFFPICITSKSSCDFVLPFIEKPKKVIYTSISLWPAVSLAIEVL